MFNVLFLGEERGLPSPSKGGEKKGRQRVTGRILMVMKVDRETRQKIVVSSKDHSNESQVLGKKGRGRPRTIPFREEKRLVLCVEKHPIKWRNGKKKHWGKKIRANELSEGPITSIRAVKKMARLFAIGKKKKGEWK